ncbi:Polyketide transferase ATR5 [Metarhizium anisopliae]|nr:Polyketide transferase ATR5 [Metarhizium anisopliae]
MAQRQEVEFKTVDGVLLRGYLYPAQSRGPGVVMSPGFNATTEMLGMPTTAAAFQAAGITALAYDPRGVGMSDGEPRNNINPSVQVDDMSDAMTFLLSHRSVDRRQGVGIWGMSLGGTVAMAGAALDPRARWVIAVSPATEPTHNMVKMRQVLAQAARDRESQIKGNAPYNVPMLDGRGENPAGFDPGLERGSVMRMLEAYSETDVLRAALAPHHVNRTTVGTYRYMLMWDSRHLWKLITQPVLFAIARHDDLIGTDKQIAHFEALPAPKRLHVADGATHMDILDNARRENVNEAQVLFVQDVLAGRVVVSPAPA